MVQVEHLILKTFKEIKLTARNFETVFTGKQGAGVGRLEESPFGKFLDTMGSIVRIPSSALLMGDEFFKSMNYRTYIRTEIATDGYKRGLRGHELAGFVKKEMDNHVTDLGRAFNEEGIVAEAVEVANKKGLKFAEKEMFIDNYVKKSQEARDAKSSFDRVERDALVEKAKQETLINTFTADVGVPLLKEVQAFIKKVPLLAFVVPFVRTPANILVFGLKRTPLGVLHQAGKEIAGSSNILYKASKDTADSLRSADPRVRADVMGRLTTAVMSNVAVLYFLMTNKNLISGFGPTDKTEREAWKDAGNQEYSIKIGGKWYSYQRLDPMATMLGLMADTVQVLEEGFGGDDETQRDALGKIMTGMILVAKNNITNKSYVQGFDTLLQAIAHPESKGQAFISNIIGGFQPNVFNQMMNMEDERLIRETRGTFDYLLKRNPLTTETLPVRRDALGKEQTIETGGGVLGVLNPIYSRTISDDLVYNELNALGGVAKPRPTIAGGQIDLRNFKIDGEVNTAYDHFLEQSGKVKLNGKTMHEALTDLIRSEGYQGMVTTEQHGYEFDSPQLKAIKNLITQYRTLAKSDTMDKYPELQNAFNRYVVDRQMNKRVN